MADPICPKGMVLQKPEGAVHPDVPAFCINIMEVSQAEDNAFWAQRLKSGFELLVKRTNGDSRSVRPPQGVSLRQEAPQRQIQNKDVSGVEIRAVTTEAKEQPTGDILGPKKPAVLRTWQEARDYCKGTYPGGDLPTGRQWENACGKGKYCTPSGNELKHTEARFASWGKGPVNVDSYRPNARGARRI